MVVSSPPTRRFIFSRSLWNGWNPESSGRITLTDAFRICMMPLLRMLWARRRSRRWSSVSEKLIRDGRRSSNGQFRSEQPSLTDSFDTKSHDITMRRVDDHDSSHEGLPRIASAESEMVCVSFAFPPQLSSCTYLIIRWLYHTPCPYQAPISALTIAKGQ